MNQITQNTSSNNRGNYSGATRIAAKVGHGIASWLIGFCIFGALLGIIFAMGFQPRGPGWVVLPIVLGEIIRRSTWMIFEGGVASQERTNDAIARQVMAMQSNEESYMQVVNSSPCEIPKPLRSSPNQPLTNDEIKSALIADASTTMSFAMQDQLPRLKDSTIVILATAYGKEWLSDHETILRAMLAYVKDHQLLMKPESKIREFFVEGAPESLLFNIFSCMHCADAFTQPTVIEKCPDPIQFVTAFGPEDGLTIADENSTAYTIMLAMSFGVEFVRLRSNAA